MYKHSHVLFVFQKRMNTSRRTLHHSAKRLLFRYVSTFFKYIFRYTFPFFMCMYTCSFFHVHVYAKRKLI